MKLCLLPVVIIFIQLRIKTRLRYQDKIKTIANFSFYLNFCLPFWLLQTKETGEARPWPRPTHKQALL